MAMVLDSSRIVGVFKEKISFVFIKRGNVQ
jgi:hypothetical protein